MKRPLLAGVGALAANLFAAGLLPAAGHAQGTVKIGVILPYSGQFADTATQIDDGIKLYLKQRGDKLGGKSVELIRKDVGGIAPPVAKRLAQELVTRDNVDILAGFSLTPNALAAADVSAEAKKFMVVMNAATGIVITKSPYMVREMCIRDRHFCSALIAPSISAFSFPDAMARAVAASTPK